MGESEPIGGERGGLGLSAKAGDLDGVGTNCLHRLRDIQDETPDSRVEHLVDIVHFEIGEQGLGSVNKLGFRLTVRTHPLRKERTSLFEIEFAVWPSKEHAEGDGLDFEPIYAFHNNRV